jgi:hypothetical protein
MLRRTATKLADLDALLTLDPKRIGRRLANKQIFRLVNQQITNRLLIKRNWKWPSKK